MPAATSPRPSVSDATRQALIEAATTVFAERGYDGGSVRIITRAAGANQAAITYHFGGKDGLYRAVLRAALAAFEEQSLIDEATAREVDPVEATRRMMRQFLLPLVRKDRLGRYVQIFGWEGVNPSAVYEAFLAEERPRAFTAVEALARRFLTDAGPAEIGLAAFWLIQQPVAIVRHAKRLQAAPFGLDLDESGVDRLVDLLTHLSLGGLRGLAAGQPIGNGR